MDNERLFLLAASAGGLLFVLVLFGAVARKTMRRKLNVSYFTERWQNLQRLCADKEQWAMAVISADKLLDEALKRQHFKGKTMGERLMNAQKTLSDNDGVWYGHKLRNRIVHEAEVRLKEKDVKNALVGFRQALRDLGALR